MLHFCFSVRSFGMNSINAPSMQHIQIKMLIFYISIFCLFRFSFHSQQPNIDVFRTILEKSRLFDYDGVCKLWIGPKLIVFLFRPADVELILSSHVYIDKSAEYDFFKPWLGEGLLISTGKFRVFYTVAIKKNRKNNHFYIQIQMLYV